MKKLLVAAVFAAGLCGVSFGLECDKKVEKLKAAEIELEIIVYTIDGNDWTRRDVSGTSLASVYRVRIDDNYRICSKDIAWEPKSAEHCLKKIKQKHKKLFKQKGLEWNEENIRAEYQRAIETTMQAEESCKEAQKAADEAERENRRKDILN